MKKTNRCSYCGKKPLTLHAEGRTIIRCNRCDIEVMAKFNARQLWNKLMDMPYRLNPIKSRDMLLNVVNNQQPGVVKKLNNLDA